MIDLDAIKANAHECNYEDFAALIVEVERLKDVADKRGDECEALREQLKAVKADRDRYEEREASCCPEDVGCDEYIKTLTKRAEYAETRLRADLALNATMLARQTDLARDAEAEAARHWALYTEAGVQRGEAMLEVERVQVERDAARRAHLTCQAAWETQRDELAQYRAALDGMTTHCLCGCPIAEHESDGDDGESCDHDDHECLRTCRSIAELVARLRTNQKETP